MNIWLAIIFLTLAFVTHSYGACSEINKHARGKGISLHEAATNGEVALVRELLETGAHVDARNQFLRTPLYGAAANGHVEIVQLLLRAGADVNAQDLSLSTPLHEASNDTIAQLFIDAEADINAQDRSLSTPLLWAALRGHIEVVRTLLKAGADVNTRDAHQTTPVHVASTEAIAQRLIDAGVPVNARDDEQWTPFHSACASGRLAVVLVLHAAGAHIDAQDVFGRTPLHMASTGTIAKLLIDAGVAVDTRDKFLRTPLHIAAAEGHVEVVQLLLGAGADVNAQDIALRTPLQEAIEYAQELITTRVEIKTRDMGIVADHKALIRVLLKWRACVDQGSVSFLDQHITGWRNI